MNFAKTLLAGAALCALATAPALAGHAPNIHLRAAAMNHKGAHFTIGASHSKTNIHDPSYTNFTTTFTISGYITRTGFFKQFILLYAYDWTNGCVDVGAKETFKSTPNLTTIHKIKQGSVTGTCSSLPLTFYGPNYKLLSSTATFDSFTGHLVAKKTSSGYNLHANIPTFLGIH